MRICEKPYYYGVISSSFDLKRIYLKTANNINTTLFFTYYYSWRKLITFWKAVSQPSGGWHFYPTVLRWTDHLRNCLADERNVLRRLPASSEVAIGAARFPVATEIATMRCKPIQSEESALYCYYWFTIERMDEFFHKGRQRENLRFQPGDESRLGRPLL